MHELLKFDYYYGKEAEQYSFYRVPKMLIKDKHFSGLSDSAKILYGLMLDRMGLSIKNEWQDDLDRTYIIYTVEDVMEDLNCSKTKAVKTMTELDVHGGIGLIEKVRRGLGKPDIIYVKNFVCVQIVENDADSEGEKPATPHKYTEVAKMDFKKSTNQTSRSSESGLQEVAEMDFKESTNQTSRSSKDIADVLGKETIDTYNTSDTRGTSQSYGLNYQKLGRELMSQDRLALMDGGKCILQVRGVRPFFSDKVDITKHEMYPELSDYNKKNEFDIAEYVRNYGRVLFTRTDNFMDLNLDGVHYPDDLTQYAIKEAGIILEGAEV